MKTAPITQYVRLFSLLFMANSANAEQIKNKVLEYKKLEWQLPNA